MKKIEKMIHQIIRFRGNIEAFLVSIEEFSRSNYYPKVTYSYPRVTYSDPKVTQSDPTHLPLPPPTSPGQDQAISQV